MISFHEFFSEVVRLCGVHCVASVEAHHTPGKLTAELRYGAYDCRPGVGWFLPKFATPEECILALSERQAEAGYALAQIPPTVPDGAEVVGSLEGIAS